MASKFFTWTKGDRRHAADAYQSYRVDGLMPVDQYPLDQHWEAKADLSLSRKRKKRHRPKPLQLQSAGSRSAVDASSFVPSSVLHEPAITSVASASNLLAVVNDMLRSPALNNPQPSPSPNPDTGRRRSHTAPPTPAIAELPGSILLENQGFPNEAKESESAQADELRLKRKTLASPFQLPASIPNAPQHKKSLSLNTATSKWGAGAIAGSSGTRGSRAHRPSMDSKSSGHRSSRENRGDQNENSSIIRSPITEVTEDSSSLAFAESESSNAPSKQSVRAPQVSETEQLKATIAAQNKTISTLKSQFHHLRISHEAHAASIAEAHRKETDAMKAYLHYLEASYDSRHPNMHISIPSNDLRGPSPDIKVPGDTGKKPTSSDSDASTSQPQDSNDKDNATRERNGSEASISSSEGQEKVKKLKQKLDLATQHLAAMKDQMEMLMSRKDAYKDRVADLEVRVRNNHELLIDLRESEYKLEMERRLMHERHRQLNGELEALRTRPEQSQISKLETDLAEEKQRAGLLTAQLEAAQMRTPVPDVVGELTRKIDDMQQRLKEKDEQVYELRHVNQALQLDLEELDTQQAKYAAEHDEELAQEARKRREVKNRARLAESENTELREVVEAQGHDLVTVQEEYERLRKLLHSEMRSQAKESISRNLIPGTPSSADGYLELVAVEARRRVQALIARENVESTQQPSTDPYERIDLLEKEIQHHVNELIRCKRDNRSYRKDIKRANTKIDKMRNSVYSAGNNSDSNLYRQASLQRPITPTESPIKQKPSMAGLGISTIMPSPSTSAPSSQPTSAVTGNISDSSFPPARPKTPGRSNTNKKLPPYPQLPEQVAEHLSNFNFPPPCDPPAYPPPKDPPSRPKTPKTPKTPRTPYKLTPTITRTPSLSSIKPTPSSPANRPSTHRFHTTTCFGSDTHPSSPAAPAAVAVPPAPPPAPHHRAGTQRSLSESILSSYAGTTTTPPPAADKAVVDQARPVLVAHAPGPPEVVDNTVGLTALPPVVRPGSGSAARGQEERLGLVRKRSDSVLRRKESQDGFLRRVASGRSLGVEGVISRFNSRGRMGAGVVVPVMLESEDEK